MFCHFVVLGLTIGSFHGKQAQRMFPYIPVKYQYIEDMDIFKGVGSIQPTKPLSVLIAKFDDDNVFRFLHQNYTLTRCGWDRPMSTMQKALVFKEIIRHLQTNYNQTLCSRLTEEDDVYAWLLSGVAASDL